MTASTLIFNQLLPGDGDLSEHALSQVSLPFEKRQRSRLRVEVESGPLGGQAVGIDLPRGTVMRAQARLVTGQSEQAMHCLQIDAAPEQLAQVTAATTRQLTAIAYHLGNRHVPIQVGEQWLRLQQDHVLENMVLGLGGQVIHIEAAFEPESGAYHGGHHHHGHDGDEAGHHHHAHGDSPPPDRRHSPRIHDLSDQEDSP
ncbi:MAG: urease accessory protein UreE [Burkholderiaceae bacterium]